MPGKTSRLAFLLGTTIGRKRLRQRLIWRARPLIFKAARLWRATMARRTRVTGVTGTFGKTSTTAAITLALGEPLSARMASNHGIGVAYAVMRIRPWQRHAALELAIPGPGQAAQPIGLARPDIGVVTSIGSEHLSSYKSLENTAREKSEMIRRLPATGIAVLNGDDPRVAAMAAFSPCRVVTFGLQRHNDVRAECVELDWPAGMRFDVVAHGERCPARIPLLGSPGVYAALAGASVAVSQGVGLEEAVKRMSSLKARHGRLEALALPGGAFILRDDHKGPVESFEVAFDILSQIPARRKIVLLGEYAEETGENPRDLMRRLGERAARISDVFIFFGSRKSAQPFRAGARRGGMAEENIHFVHADIPACVALLGSLLAPGDVLLLKGRSELRLGRVALALLGRDVRCAIRRCSLFTVRCEDCSLLARGWDRFEDFSPMALKQ